MTSISDWPSGPASSPMGFSTSFPTWDSTEGEFRISPSNPADTSMAESTFEIFVAARLKGSDGTVLDFYDHGGISYVV